MATPMLANRIMRIIDGKSLSSGVSGAVGAEDEVEAVTGGGAWVAITPELAGGGLETEAVGSSVNHDGALGSDMMLDDLRNTLEVTLAALL